MNADDRLRAAAALEAVLREADDEELQITDVQRTYIRGAIDTLRALTPDA